MGEAERRADFIAEIDEDELAVRLMECSIGLKRPDVATPARQILEDARLAFPPGHTFLFDAMARVALEYFRECIREARRPS